MIRSTLKGTLKGLWAVTVRTKWRIVFRLEGTDAFDALRTTALLRCLKALQPGGTLTVWKSDRLARRSTLVALLGARAIHEKRIVAWEEVAG
jgi:DNA invertase Pin-like site-specific DNA recombinase